MQDFPLVLSEYEEINCLLYKPINSTQRIKYTCFNTSGNYIVVGSTSGSIYLFAREPCSFLQLIPLSEGAVTRVQISPDEKTIALSTSRGSVCLVTLKPTAKLIAVSTEHISEQINCLCWNDNSSEIYVGDGAGKVSVMVLSIFTVNGMFQAPACVLMHLDSAIVQLSFSLPLLLVSTLTRCYICDTVQEQYKQIGNKTRNGEFGACFFKTYTSDSESTSTTQREEKLVNRVRAFSFIPEGDSNLQDESSLKIFSARPGSRLWEVSGNGIVMKTHQFKEALAIPPTTLCKPNLQMNSKKRTEECWPPQSINFSHLFVIAEKYLFSYTSNGLYIINPTNAMVVLWSNEFSNINLAETIENKVYLMTTDGQFHCLSLSSLDSLILRLYNRKRYDDCLDLCLLYKAQLHKLVDSLDDSFCDIEYKSKVLPDVEIVTILHPIILSLQSNLNTCPIKLNSGIVVVNSGNTELKSGEYLKYKSTTVTQSSLQSTEMSNEEFVQSNIEINSETIDTVIKNEKRLLSDKENCNTEELLLNDGKEVENELTESLLNFNENLTQRIQSDLQDIYSLTADIKSYKNEKQLEVIMTSIQERLKIINNSYETETELKAFLYEVLRTAELHYLTTLLECTPIQLIESTRNYGIIMQIMKAFVEVNAQSCIRCECGAPCPVDQLPEAKFLVIGKSLLRKIDGNFEECLSLCNKVPYMWRDYLPKCIEKKRPINDLVLRQCLQTKDNAVLSILLPVLDTKHWSAMTTYVAQLQKGRCLLCGSDISKAMDQYFIDWSGMVHEMMTKLGPDYAVAFLTKLEKYNPTLVIDKNIFQSLIFTKILYQNGLKRVVDFNKTTLGSTEYSTMCSEKVRDQLAGALEKDLGRPLNKNLFGSGGHHWGMRYKSKSSTCPCCTLSLQTPVLLGSNGIAIFSCGHAYHVNCMIEKKLTSCILHS